MMESPGYVELDMVVEDVSNGAMIADRTTASTDKASSRRVLGGGFSLAVAEVLMICWAVEQGSSLI